MKVVVKKWGNSASVRIPAAIMATSKLTVDQAVDVRESNGCIVIEPVCENELNSLVARITPENLHGEVDFGPPVGREAF